MPSDETQPHEYHDEDALEPRHLIRRSDVILRTGHLMLGAGTSSLRVKEAMREVAAALDVDRASAQVTFTDITLTIARRGIFRTQVAEVTNPGVNADRIASIREMSLALTPHLRVKDVEARLDEIEARGPLYPAWLVMLAVGLACGSLSILSNGGWQELVAVVPAAMITYGLHRRLSRFRLNLIATVIVSTVVSTGLYLLFSWLLHGGNLADAHRVAGGFVAAAIFLVPGFPLVTGGLDLARLDLEAGMGRVTYAGLVMLSIGIGVWAVASVGSVPAVTVPPLDIPLWGAWLLRLAASFLAVFGWAVMFNAPLSVCVASGGVAVLGNALRLVMIDHGVVAHVATFTGALVIGLLCHLVAAVFRLSALIMLVPTLLVMIPGVAGLHALMYFNSGDLMAALANGIAVVLAAIAMVAGLVASMMLCDPGWAFTRDDPPTLGSLRRQMADAVTPSRWRR